MVWLSCLYMHKHDLVTCMVWLSCLYMHKQHGNQTKPPNKTTLTQKCIHTTQMHTCTHAHTHTHIHT